MTSPRIPRNDVDPVFVHRWSPRAYTGEAIDDATLHQLFEAARWAPSANNSQPWRFIYSKNGSESWPLFQSLLTGANPNWAHKASAIAILLSKTTYLPAGQAEPVAARNHSFDAGAAWASLAFQALRSGWRTRAMGGYDKDKARALLGVPEDYKLEVAIAIGRQADKSTLAEDLRGREVPSDRLPVEQLVSEGRFAFGG